MRIQNHLLCLFFICCCFSCSDNNNRITISIPIDQEDGCVGGISFINGSFLTDRPMDIMFYDPNFSGKDTICSGLNSEVRFKGKYTFSGGFIESTNNDYLRFRKTSDGWTYVGGRGRYTFKDGETITFGTNITLATCLKGIQSKDAIIQEGNITNLGIITQDSDISQATINKLQKVFREGNKYIQMAVIETLSKNCGEYSIEALLSLLNTVKNSQIIEFINGSIAICSGGELINDLTKDINILKDAAKRYLSGRDTRQIRSLKEILMSEGPAGYKLLSQTMSWSDAMLEQQIKADHSDSCQMLIERLRAEDVSIRLAAVELLHVGNCSQALQFLKKVSKMDSDENVRKSATYAVIFLTIH